MIFRGYLNRDREYLNFFQENIQANSVDLHRMFCNGCVTKRKLFKTLICDILDKKKKMFAMRVVRHWTRLPREVVYPPSLEMFTVSLDRTWSNPI